MSDRPWRVTFDGSTESYGTSSYLYFLGLWLAQANGLGWLVPKVISVVCHLGLLAIITKRGLRAADSGRIGYGLLWLVLASPMAFRWLGDGLETSLFLLVTVGLSVWQPWFNERDSPARFVAGLVVGWLCFMLRPEFIVIICALATMRVLEILLDKPRSTHPAASIAASLHLLLGAGIGVATIWAIFGHISPDTSVAKQSGAISPVDALVRIVSALGGSATFGIGLATLWLFLGIQQLREGRRIAVVSAWALPFALLGIISLEGVNVQGVRHVAWAFIPGIIIALERSGSRRKSDVLAPIDPPRFVASSLTRHRVWAVGAMALVAVWSLESSLTYRIIEGRSAVLRQFERDRVSLSGLAGREGAAYDIGFISYFSGGKILDMNGLVHGRAFAAAGHDARLDKLVATRPDFLFVTEGQAKNIGTRIDLAAFQPVRYFEFTNLRSSDSHYLLVRKSLTHLFPPPYPTFPRNGRGGALQQLFGR